MRRGRAKRARGGRPLHRSSEQRLEELVRTVAALDGPGAADLLSGLSASVRPDALGLLRRLERGDRAERHARLAMVLARRPPSPRDTEGIPGRLGREVRERLAQPGRPDGPADASLLARWSRRLLCELDAGTGLYPP
jgi:hypothetical protein